MKIIFTPSLIVPSLSDEERARILKAAGPAAALVETRDAAAQREQIVDAEVVFGRVPPDIFTLNRRLRYYHSIGAGVDAILTPATAITAPPIPPGGERGGWSDLSATTEKMRYAFPANLTGLPAITFPVGYDENGLPVGMQAMGRYWEEAVLLRIAYCAEQVVARHTPQMFFPILGR